MAKIDHAQGNAQVTGRHRDRLIALLQRAVPMLEDGKATMGDRRALAAEITETLAAKRGRKPTANEAEILRLLGMGKTVREIKAELGVGLATVDRVRKRLKEQAAARGE